MLLVRGMRSVWSSVLLFVFVGCMDSKEESASYVCVKNSVRCDGDFALHCFYTPDFPDGFVQRQRCEPGACRKGVGCVERLGQGPDGTDLGCTALGGTGTYCDGDQAVHCLDGYAHLVEACVIGCIMDSGAGASCKAPPVVAPD